MRRKSPSLPTAKIRWKSPSGALLIVATLFLVSFAGWSLMNAGQLKDMRRSLSERNQWLSEITTSIELLETPPLRKNTKGTLAAMENLAHGLENLRLSLTYPHEPFEKLMSRVHLTIVDIAEEMQKERRSLPDFRKRARTNLRRAQTMLRSDIVRRADEFTRMARSLNQALSGAAILAGFCLILLVNLILKVEHAEILLAAYDIVEEERDVLTRSQLQHYKQTFASITDNLDHGVVVYRRDEVLFANRSLMLLLRPGAKGWKDIEPELDLLLDRVRKSRSELLAEGEVFSRVRVDARRFDGSSVRVEVAEDLPTIFRGGDAQMVFIYPKMDLDTSELKSA